MKSFFKHFSPFLLSFLYVIGIFFASTTIATGTVFFSTDWDTGTPATCWPCKTSSCSSSFSGWYGGDWNETYANCGRSSTQKNSGAYSYYQSRASGTYATCDLVHDFAAPYPTTIYVRFYLYLTTNWNSFGRSEYVHWIFTNSARSNTGFRLNFLGDDQYNCGDGGIHMIPEGNGGRSWWFGDSTWNICAKNFKNYIGAWHSFEYKMQISGSNIILTEWIDGVLTRGPTTGPGQDTSSFNKIIISGWENTGVSHAGDFYIDDIVVSDTYIGPITGTTKLDKPNPIICNDHPEDPRCIR
jgi:hypothetical protein